MSNSLQSHGQKHAKPSYPSSTPRVYSNSCPLSQWCHSTISSSVTPFSACSQSSPESESSSESALLIRQTNIETSASVSLLPMNIQGWFPLGLIGLIALQSKELSRVFSSTQFGTIKSLALSLLYGPTPTSVHDYWKNHSFDYMDVCRQSDVSAF